MASIAVEELPPISRKDRELMRTQHQFLRRIYITANSFLVLGLVQWVGLTLSSSVAQAVALIFYVEQFVIWIAFLSLLSFMFFYKYIRKSSLFNAWMAAAATAELGTIILAQPLAAAVHTDILYAMGTVLLLTGISIPLSLQIHDEMQHSKKELQIWTGRYFLLTGMGTIFLKTIARLWLSVFVALIILVFLTIHVLNFCKAMGSMDFFLSNKTAYILYGTLLYYNFSAIYSTTLVFLNAIRQIQY